jgi:hypothetical protein
MVQGKIKIYVFSSLILSLIAALLFTAAYFISFDSYIGYFSTSAILPGIAMSVTLLTLAWIFSSLLIIPKNSVRTDAVPYGKGSKFTSAVCFAGFVIYTLYRLIFSRTIATVPGLLTFFCIIAGALASIYFLMTALNKGSASARVYAGFAPEFWAALSMTEAYLNKNIAMNNPFKIAQMMAMLSLMLFMIYELRFLLGRAMPRLFLAFALAGVLVSSVFIIPFLAVSLIGTYTLTDLLPEGILNLLAAGFMVSRLIDYKAHQSAASAENQSPESDIK